VELTFDHWDCDEVSVAQDRAFVLTRPRMATLDNTLSEHSAFLPDRPKAVAAVRRAWGAVREWQVCFEEMGASPPLVQTMGLASSVRLKVEQDQLVSEDWRLWARAIGLQGA
jgi:hypothetical protein